MAMVAAPVAAWAMGVGASAAVGAIAGAVAVGVVSGAVMGAATAVISGGNILDGALKGAVIGGVSGGVMSGLGMVTGMATAESQLASFGLSPTGEALAPGTVTSVAPGATEGLATPALTGPEAGLAPRALEAPVGPGSIAAPTTGPQIADAPAAPVTPPTDRSFLNKMMFNQEGSLNEGMGEIISGGVEGTAQALLADDYKPETQSEYLQNVQAMNVAGSFQGRTANIQIPDYWAQYNKVPTQQVVAQGGAYAQPA